MPSVQALLAVGAAAIVSVCASVGGAALSTPMPGPPAIGDSAPNDDPTPPAEAEDDDAAGDEDTYTASNGDPPTAV